MDGKGSRGGSRCVRSLLRFFPSSLVPFSIALTTVLTDTAGAERRRTSEGLVAPKKSCDSSGGEVTTGGLTGKMEESTRLMPWAPCAIGGEDTPALEGDTNGL